MKIRRLTLQGIGPFAGEYTVDFSAFDQSGLFLLEGPTGSGKSSIIDALMFALYGRVTGNLDQADQRLRSTYCTDDNPSSVSLLFETTSGIYQVVRTPGYQPGNRKTPKPATVRLDRVTVDDEGEVVSREGIAAKKAEVEQEVLSLVGLDANQFRQTVVLPQGDFSAFLMARSEDRRKILQEIFGTALYQDIQTYLQQQARDSRELVRVAQTRTEGHLESLVKALEGELGEPIAKVLSVDGKLLPLEQIDLDSLRTLFGEVTAHLAENQDLLREDLRQAQERAEASRSVLIAAERAEESVRQRRFLQKTLADLEGEQPVVDRSRGCLAAARSADEPLRRYREWQKLAAEETGIESSIQSLMRSLETLLSGDAGRAITISQIGDLGSLDLARMMQQVAQKRGGLQELLAQEESQTQLAEAVDRQHSRHNGLIRCQEEAIVSAHLLEEKRKVAQAILNNGPQLAIDEQNLTIAQNAAELMERISGAEAVHNDAAKVARCAGREESDLRGLWLADSAGAIAAELQPGEPCPVCGSKKHPSPAVPGGDPVSLEVVNRAADVRRQADHALQDATSTLIQLQTQRELLGEVPPYDDVALEQLQAELSQRRADYDRSEETVRLADRDLVDLSGKIQSLGLEIVRAEENLAEARDRLAQSRKTIEAESHPFASIREKVAALDLIHQRISQVVETQHRLRAATERTMSSLRDLEESTKAAGYSADPEGYRQVVGDALPETEMQALAESIASHQARLAEVTQQLEGMLLDGEVEARAEALPRLRREHDAAREATDEGQRALADWLAYARTLRQLCDDTNTLIDQWAQESERAAPVTRLASLANASGADNLLKTPLASYVLMRRLDEVIEATNPRLKEFSHHHYELVRQAEGKDGNRKTGLGLEILDNETGHRRPPGTLSGGEVFYTSLALALGLAEIVTAEAGGFDLETIFIDEGFGSLDAETLDIVMKHLEDLRSDGRTVGVVSHVAEMQTRIAEGIKVRRLGPGQGSTLTMRC